ncbi:MAG: sigma-70 family RNA polymerase sigma factor [Chloroflexota bacterium]
MDELTQIVQRVRSGEVEAYSLIVERFQDMATGYAYAILGDFGLAEDAAQEAFLHAFYQLAQLRQPAAFPGWFRRVVYKQCDRLLRGNKPLVTDLSNESQYIDQAPTPETIVTHRETKQQVHSAIMSLPLPERETVILFYINQFSQKEISLFLEVPTSTVKSRLFTARKRLQENMLAMIQNNLAQNQPSQDPQFAQNVMLLLAAAAAGNAEQTQSLIAADARLVNAKGSVNDRLWVGEVTALDWAVMHQNKEVIKLLLAAGADINAPNKGMTPLQSAIDLLDLPDYDYDRGMIDFLMENGAEMDIFSALFLGDFDLTKKLVEANPTVVHARGPNNATPLCFAGAKEAELFLVHGADPLANTTPSEGNGSSPHLLDNPIQVLARWPAREPIRLLLTHASVAVDPYLDIVLAEEEAVKTAVSATPSLVHAQTDANHVLGAGHRLLHIVSILQQWQF